MEELLLSSEVKVGDLVTGEVISVKEGKLHVPNNPVIPFIEGDGIGVDITPAMQKVIDASVKKAYKGEKKISWYEVYTGEKCFKKFQHETSLKPMEQWYITVTLKS